MRTGTMLFLAAVAVACVSNRERRHSAFAAAHTEIHTRGDTAWHRWQQGSYAVQLLELEEWSRYTDTCTTDTVPYGSNTVTTGRNIVPTVSNYRRARSITIRADSNTVAAGRLTDSSVTNTFATERDTASSERKTLGISGYMGLLGMVIVLVLLVCALVRRILR